MEKTCLYAPMMIQSSQAGLESTLNLPAIRRVKATLKDNMSGHRTSKTPFNHHLSPQTALSLQVLDLATELQKPTPGPVQSRRIPSSWATNSICKAASSQCPWQPSHQSNQTHQLRFTCLISTSQTASLWSRSVTAGGTLTLQSLALSKSKYLGGGMAKENKTLRSKGSSVNLGNRVSLTTMSAISNSARSGGALSCRTFFFFLTIFYKLFRLFFLCLGNITWTNDMSLFIIASIKYVCLLAFQS